MANATTTVRKQEPFAREERLNTRNGTTFDPNADTWQVNTNGGTRYFDLSRLEELCEPQLAHAARKTIIWYLENRSVPHANNMFNRFLHFLGVMVSCSDCKVDSITETMIANYREHLDQETEWYLGSLRGCFQRSKALGISVVTDGAAQFLEEIVLKGNRKGGPS